MQIVLKCLAPMSRVRSTEWRTKIYFFLKVFYKHWIFLSFGLTEVLKTLQLLRHRLVLMKWLSAPFLNMLLPQCNLLATQHSTALAKMPIMASIFKQNSGINNLLGNLNSASFISNSSLLLQWKINLLNLCLPFQLCLHQPKGG